SYDSGRSDALPVRAMLTLVVDRRIKSDNSPLMEAAIAGHVDIVNLLINHGAEINAHSTSAPWFISKFTISTCPAIAASIKVATVCTAISFIFLLIAFTTPNWLETDGKLEKPKFEQLDLRFFLISLMLIQLTFINSNLFGDFKIKNFSYDSGRSDALPVRAMLTLVVDRRIKSDNSPLMEAAIAGHVDIVNLLINHGAEINAHSTSAPWFISKFTISTCPAIAASIKVATVCTAISFIFLLIAFTTPNWLETDGKLEKPKFEQLDLRFFLISLMLIQLTFINSNLFGDFKIKNFSYDSGRSDALPVRAMLTLVVDRRIKSDNSPLMEAAIAGHVDIVNLLINHGAEINAHSTSAPWFISKFTISTCPAIAASIKVATVCTAISFIFLLIAFTTPNWLETDGKLEKPKFEQLDLRFFLISLMLIQLTFINSNLFGDFKIKNFSYDSGRSDALPVRAMLTLVVDRRIKSDNSPLMEAAIAGHVDIVNLLINHGAEINAHSTSAPWFISKFTISTCPAIAASIKVATVCTAISFIFLLIAFTTPNWLETDGKLEKPKFEQLDLRFFLISLMLIQLTFINSNLFGDFKIKNFSYDSGRSDALPVRAMLTLVVDRRIKSDNSPLMEAAIAGHVDIVNLLINHGAEINAHSTSAPWFISKFTISTCPAIAASIKVLRYKNLQYYHYEREHRSH
ncbi:unnamed protein product, partial [Trichogramma brassicae]